jgi:hypothetical protein
LNYLNTKGSSKPPKAFLLRQILQMFPGALPSQVMKEDWRTIQELLIVENAIAYHRDIRRRLAGG